MSPASSGNLEVEKYIGACLISQSRPKNNNTNNNREVFFSRVSDIYSGNYVNFPLQRCNSVDRWAGGMPLISFANHQKRNRRMEQQNETRSASPKQQEDQSNPLARLAVHTQGAPLIVTKTFNNRRNKVHKNNSTNKTFDNSSKKPKSINKLQKQNSAGIDTVSVTSDESSGSANSDNCLPRIIKPRKRRKKDRKPSILGHPLNQDGFSTDSASPDIDTNSINVLGPYTPFIFDPHLYGLVPENFPLTTNPSNEDYDYFNDVSETPQLHHSFEDVEELDDGVDINGNQSPTLCQCRYCDPSGQIWDVDRNCYSPFLTAPVRGLANFVQSILPMYDDKSPDDFLEHSCLIHSMSSISLEEDNNREQKVDSKCVPSSSSDLEVSTEIVTSLNGHRDIEIKFFSSSSAESLRALPKGSSGIVNSPDRINSGRFCVNRSCEVSVNNHCKILLPEE